MCGSPKAASSILVSKPARSMMASLSLSQRAKLAEVANRADDKRAAKEEVIAQQRRETEHNHKQTTLNSQALANRLKQKEMLLLRAKYNDIRANDSKENVLLRFIHWLDKKLAF